MSNRSLMEFNHDYAHRIVDEHADFITALRMYLGSADKENAKRLEHFGVTVLGMRHHSDDYYVDWGGQIHQRGRRPR